MVCTDKGEIIIGGKDGEFANYLKQSPCNLLKTSFHIECIAIYSKGFVVAGENA